MDLNARFKLCYYYTNFLFLIVPFYHTIKELVRTAGKGAFTDTNLKRDTFPVLCGGRVSVRNHSSVWEADVILCKEEPGIKDPTTGHPRPRTCRGISVRAESTNSSGISESRNPPSQTWPRGTRKVLEIHALTQGNYGSQTAHPKSDVSQKLSFSFSASPHTTSVVGFPVLL